MSMHPQTQYLLNAEQYEQRTEAWYAARRGLLTASDVAGVLGIKPFETFNKDPRMDVLLKKVTKEPVNSPYLAHGVEYEDIVRQLFEEKSGENVHEVGLLIHPQHRWLGGSPDGITSSGACVEIKCPQGREIVPGKVPEHYYPQIQVCMEICDLDSCFFIQYKSLVITWPFPEQYDVVEIPRDREWFAKHVPTMHNFWEEMMEAKADPEAFYAKHPKLRGKKKSPTPRTTTKKQPVRCMVVDDLYAVEAVK